MNHKYTKFFINCDYFLEKLIGKLNLRDIRK